MTNWCRQAAEQILSDWPAIEQDAGEMAQNEQDADVGQERHVELVSAIIE